MTQDDSTRHGRSSCPMTFSESIETCFKKYSQGRGRASRSEYWYFYLFSVVVSFGLEVLILESNRSTLIALFVNLIGLLILIPEWTVAVRRLHDTNRSGWNLFWVFLPVIGWIIQIVYLTQPGTVGPNDYGD